MQTQTATSNSKPDHLFYLWHLRSIGLLKDPDQSPFDDEIWQNNKRVKVAIIDNGLCEQHANLDPIDRALEIDFASREFGARYEPFSNSGLDPDECRTAEGPEQTGAVDSGAFFPFEKLLQRMIALSDNNVERGEQEIREFLQRLPEPRRDVLTRLIFESTHQDFAGETYKGIRNPSYAYSGHGTACAGLVAGHPKGFIPDGSEAECAGDPHDDRIIPYFGVDPWAQIIPINTPYNHEIWPLVMSLLYAVAQDADVILIPRAVNDLRRSFAADPDSDSGDGANAGSDGRATRFDDDHGLRDDRETFEKLLGWVSERLPVVVAAGNDGSSRLQYPARLSESGVARNLIVVGAFNSWGQKSIYSSGTEGVTLYAPSDDGEAIHRTPSGQVIHYDDQSWRGRNLNRNVFEGTENTYSAFGVLSVDIPGPYGSSGEPGDHPPEEDAANQAGDQVRHSRHSQYTVFGGTSAASSIIAGAVSLLQKAAKLSGHDRLTVAAVRRIIANSLQDAPNLHDPSKPGTVKTINIETAYEEARGPT